MTLTLIILISSFALIAGSISVGIVLTAIRTGNWETVLAFGTAAFTVGLAAAVISLDYWLHDTFGTAYGIAYVAAAAVVIFLFVLSFVWMGSDSRTDAVNAGGSAVNE